MRTIRLGNYPIRSWNKSLRAHAKLKAARGRRFLIRNKNRVKRSEIYEMECNRSTSRKSSQYFHRIELPFMITEKIR